MSGNSIGKIFTVSTAGESHGKGLLAIVDGCPAGLEISDQDIQIELDRRKPGTSKFTTQRKESDLVEIVSGVFEGKTTGTPIGMIIRNQDQRSKDYSEIANKYRPGHADLTYDKKYGFRDYRGGGRSSARETAMRVAAGAIAKKYLKQQHDIDIYGFLSQVADIKANHIDPLFISQNPLFWPDKDNLEAVENYINNLRKQGDSIGARVDVIATNVPIGLGEPVFDRLDADIAHAMMSINAVKAVEIGDGFAVVNQHGSEHRDQILNNGFASNHAGGTLGGISSGQEIKVSMAYKPTSSILIPSKTINNKGESVDIITKGRHDPCVGVRAAPIAEAMLAIVLMDHLLRHRGQNYDVFRKNNDER